MHSLTATRTKPAALAASAKYAAKASATPASAEKNIK
jgi:hypothetical protein